MRSESCDIFCNVVDNYGDIGVCWRLARQLANEHGMEVRLWVDDLHSFGKLCPELDAELDVQHCRNVEVRHWSGDTFVLHPLPLPLSRKRERVADRSGEGVADLVIEAFACKLPQSYVEAMAACEHKPVWLNLEYLSAEEWVEGCHKLPSPHPTLPLTRYFFFPGFTSKTGGLLLERNLLARRDTFQSDAGTKSSLTLLRPAQDRPSLPQGGREQEFWRSLGVPQRVRGELRVSMFSYENEAMESLLRGWEQGAQGITVLLPEGRSFPQIASYFEQHVGRADAIWQRGNLRVHVLPFVEQERYDELLWACDINFVRGEDSCVRAQWAARPFIWQIYPQHDRVHMVKLEALRARYTAGLPSGTAQAVGDMWLAWNGGQDIAEAWAYFAAQRGALTRHGVEWARQLAPNNLALNLLDFFHQSANPRIP